MTKGPSVDIQRVEVLKGPQGTLFGRNTTGGAINYITNKPGESFEAAVGGGYGSFDTYELDAMVSGPVNEAVGARLAVRSIQSSEGWQESVSRPGDTLGEVEKYALRSIVTWDVNDALALMFSMSAWWDKSDPQSPQAIAIIPQNPFTGGAIQSPRVQNAQLIDPDSEDNRAADWTRELDLKLNDKFYSAAFHANLALDNGMELVSISSFAEARSDGSVLPAGLDALVSDYEIDASLQTISQELRLSLTDGQGLDWMIGLNVSFDEGDQHNHAYDRDVSSAFPILGIVSVFTEVGVAGESESRQSSLFGNLDWYFSESLKLTAGARYNDEQTEFQGCSFDEPTTEGTGLAPLLTAIALTRGRITPIGRGECFSLDESGSNEKFKGTLEENNVSGRVTLNYTPSDDLLYYLSYARGSKSGGFPLLPASNQSQFDPVTQEKLSAWEAGAKATLLSGSAQLNTAIFDYDYTDKQLLTRVDDPFFGPLPILQNAPESRVRGVEVSINATPLQGLFLSVAASWIETEIEQFESLDINGQPADFAGRPFNYSPELQYNALLDYSFPLAEGWMAGLAADYSFNDETNATLEGNPLYQLDAYGLLNLRARVETDDARWKVTAWGRNVTNEFQAINVYQIADVVGRYTGMPATYGISVNYRYD